MLLELSTLLSLVLVASAGSHKARLNRNHDSLAKRAFANATLEKRIDGSRWTWYDAQTGQAGACGQYIQNSDFAVALNSAQFGGGFPGPNCFKTITMSYGGKTAQATILDECPGCPYGGLDLTPGLFSFFAPQSVGVLTGTWNFGGGSTPPPAPPPPPPPPPPATTTKKPVYTPPPPPPTSTKQPASTPPPPPPPTPTTSEKPASTPPPPPPVSTSAVEQPASTPPPPPPVPASAVEQPAYTPPPPPPSPAPENTTTGYPSPTPPAPPPPAQEASTAQSPPPPPPSPTTSTTESYPTPPPPPPPAIAPPATTEDGSPTTTSTSDGESDEEPTGAVSLTLVDTLNLATPTSAPASTPSVVAAPSGTVFNAVNLVLIQLGGLIVQAGSD